MSMILEKGAMKSMETYKRFDVKHISMHILWSWTTFFASSSKNVACPSLAGMQERSLEVSSGGFFSVWNSHEQASVMLRQVSRAWRCTNLSDV